VSDSASRGRRLAVLGGKFLTVGAVSTVIEIAAFNVLVYALGIDAIVAKIVASLIALINAYYGSRLWTYRERTTRSRRGELARFLTVNAVCAALGATVLAIEIALLTYRFHLVGPVWLNLANVGAIGIVIVARFVLYTVWVFPAATSDAPAGQSSEGRGWAALVVATRAVRPVQWVTWGTVAFAFAYTLTFSASRAFVDEYDNILGAFLMLNRGELPYTGFFSHHMPFVYVAAIPFIALAGTNLVLFRVLFAIALFAWLLIIYRHLKRAIGAIGATVLLLGVTVGHLVLLTNLLVAETIVAYALIHAAVILGADLTVSGRRPTGRDVATLALLAAIPALASQSYLFVSAVLTMWTLVVVIRSAAETGLVRSLPRRIAVLVGAFAVPYASFALALLATGSLRQFIDQAYEFNLRYYSQFLSDVRGGLVETTAGNVRVFFDSYGRAIAGGTAPVQFLAASVAIGILASLTWLVAVRYRLLAAMLALLVVASAMRGGAPEAVFANPTGRFMTYGLMAILIAALVAGLAVSTRERWARPVPILPLVAAVSAALIVLPIALVGAKEARLAVSGKLGGQQTIQVASGEHELATVINAVVGTDDFFVVGPFDFHTQLFLNGNRASIYTFFLPWHAVCADCVDGYLGAIERDRPLVIAWDRRVQIWGRPVDAYFPEMLDVLDSEYYQVADPRADGVYFLRSEAEVIERRLEAAGIDAAPRR
jgi:putative flippase GtrA